MRFILIITASYPERGFAKVGPLSSKLAQAIRVYGDALPEVYEFETANDELWVRSKERRTGRTKDFLEIIAEVDVDNNRDAEWINKIDPYYDNRPNPFPDPTTPFDLIKNASDKPDHQQIYFYSFAVFAVEPSKRQAFLRDFYLPWFFGKYPEGRILVLRQDSSYEKRIAMLRWGNLCSIYNDTEIDKLKEMGFESIKSMKELQHAGLVNIEPYISSLANLFFPYKCPIVVGPFGTIFILFTNEQEIIERGVYPRTREELHLKANLMSGDKPDLSTLSVEQGWLGRYIPARTFTASELVGFFIDTIPKLNRLLRLTLDITNYRVGDEIDFISAFERFYTLDRIMLEMIYCQCASSGYSARTAVFSSVDKFSKLIPIKNGPPETFSHFFEKEFLTSVLIPSLERFKSPFGEFFKTEAIRIYESLYKTILGREGLWMSYRKTVDSVNIRKWDKKAKMFKDESMSFDDFVGKTVRAIRNTHHGYTLNNQGFASFSLHTGRLPDIFTAIPQIIWLAVLQSPETTILKNWISDTKLKSALI